MAIKKEVPTEEHFECWGIRFRALYLVDDNFGEPYVYFDDLFFEDSTQTAMPMYDRLDAGKDIELTNALEAHLKKKAEEDRAEARISAWESQRDMERMAA